MHKMGWWVRHDTSYISGGNFICIEASTLITVIFSSFNGERTVGLTLSALCKLTPPEGGWKLIAVDNGSTDATPRIMQSFVERLPLQIITVPTRGKNHALNAALEYIEGELVVFTDDDTLPEKDWLCKLENHAQLQPEYDIFGGVIDPHWPREPDAWILNSVPLGMVYAISDPSLVTGPVNSGCIWGPNMAIRSYLFNQGIRFNTEIGPDGSLNYAMGSESELTNRLANQNVKSWFCSDAKVKHIIRENQMKKSWILQRFFRYGRFFYLSTKDQSSNLPRLFGSERWLYRVLLQCYCQILILRFKGLIRQSFMMQQYLHQTQGMIYQSRLKNKHK